MRNLNACFAPLGISALALCLAACNPADGSAETVPEASESDESVDGGQESSRQPMSETAWLSVTGDGEVYVTYLDPDGRYRDTQQGKTVLTGAWEYNSSDALCFIPDEGEKACWTHGSADSDGYLRATDEDGRDIELKRVAYAPAPASDDGAEEPSADTAGRG